jgi:hypothetical protein
MQRYGLSGLKTRKGGKDYGTCCDRKSVLRQMSDKKAGAVAKKLKISWFSSRLFVSLHTKKQT